MLRAQNRRTRYDTLLNSIDYFYQIDEMARKK